MNKQEKQTNRNSQTQTKAWWLPQGSGLRGQQRVSTMRGSIYGDRRDFTLGGGQTMQYTHDVSQNCTLETYIILLTNVTPINLI